MYRQSRPVTDPPLGGFKAGVIDKLTDGKLHFPYDAVHLELNLKVVA